VGSREDDVSIDLSVVTLAGFGIAGHDGAPLERVTSGFRHFIFNTDSRFAVSWSGISLSAGDGWHDVAGGTLFVNTGSEYTVPRLDYSEVRDDVEREGNNWVYMNGFSCSQKAVCRGIYHVILPHRAAPSSIDYLDCGRIRMLAARVVANRPVFTWIYDDNIQLRISMHFMDAEQEYKRSSLYRLATKDLKKSKWESELMTDIRHNAVKGVFSGIPRLLRVFSI
jgi:hypothetical protein